MTRTKSARLSADRTAIANFLYALDAYEQRQRIHLYTIDPDAPTDSKESRPRGRYFDAEDVPGAAAWAAKQNNAGLGVYYAVNEPQPQRKKPRRDELETLHAVHVDIDAPGAMSGAWLKNARKMIGKLPVADNVQPIIVMSGGGINVVWPLQRPIKATKANTETLSEINRAVAHALGADHCHNPDRILRLPGTVNWPNALKTRRGRKPVLAVKVQDSEGDARLADFDDIPDAPAQTYSSGGTRHDYTADAYSPGYKAATLADMIEQSPRLATWKVDTEDRSEAAFAWLCAAAIALCQTVESDPLDWGADQIKNLCEAALEANHDYLGHYRDAASDWGKLGYDAERAISWAASEGIGFSPQKKAKGEKARRSREKGLPEGVDLPDFVAFLPDHMYVFMPTRSMWPAASVNAVIPPPDTYVDDSGREKPLKANMWLDRNSAMHQMTWAPGMPPVIEDALFTDGRWVERPNCNVLNIYKPPIIQPGNARRIGPWMDHLQRVYPQDWQHMVQCFAHRVQYPAIKINHGIVMGGSPGIGKDTILEPLKHGVGASNFFEVAPYHIMGRFNKFLRSVVLRISEARDQGDVNRYAFYESMKTVLASPPDTLLVDEKHVSEYEIPNLTFAIITTNYKINGMYLPMDDRRHYVAWSETVSEDFTPAYFEEMWEWYGSGGIDNVVAFLREYDLADFNPKAPPKKTDAFFEMAESHMGGDEGDLSDAIQDLDYPSVLTLDSILAKNPHLAENLRGPKNAKRVASMMDRVGYAKVANPYANSGKWLIGNAKRVVYGRRELSFKQHSDAIKHLV